MNKIYIGNLPQDITQQVLCDSFTSQCSVELTNVVVNQKGFAFADCKDPIAADRAIEHMNGHPLNGKEMSVEHSVPRGSRSRKVQVRNIPSHLNWEELDKLLAEYGTVDNCEQVSTESDTATVKVTYSTRAEAQAAIRDLNGKSVEGSILKVTLLPDSYDAIRQNRGTRFTNGNYNGPFNQTNQNFANRPKNFPELPTRMLVPSQLVGAIIGKGGESIRAITNKTHARIDVHRKDNPGATEKAITINGTAEACGAAIAAILEIVREEDKNARMAAGTWNDDEIPLKILAHNSLIGRLIGKEGRNLKAIQEKVDAKIAISNSVDMQQYNVERTIAIYGDNEKCAAAELLLMEKLRSCYESDMMSAYQQPQHYPGLNMNQLNMFPGLHGGYGPPRDPLYGMPNNYMNGPGYRNGPGFNAEGRTGQESETCTLYIPSESVGAMIGTKGSHIRNISRIANASIKIVPPEEGDDEKQRRVTIMGNPEGQWKSQFCIFDKLKQEGFFNEQDEKLTSEMTIPASIVGRVIGKGGNNVRELQRLTSSEVVIPRQSETEGLEEVPVKIVGHFFAIQSAQRKIRELLVKAREAERVGKMRPSSIPPPPVANN